MLRQKATGESLTIIHSLKQTLGKPFFSAVSAEFVWTRPNSSHPRFRRSAKTVSLTHSECISTPRCHQVSRYITWTGRTHRVETVQGWDYMRIQEPVVFPGLSHSSSTGESFKAADRGDSDLSGEDRSKWWPQLVELRRLAPVSLQNAVLRLRFPRENGGSPQDGSITYLSLQ